MSENCNIEWTDHTFNPWEGCQKVGPGCDHCYAETRNARFAGGTAINWGPGAPRRRTSAANWQQPLRWDKNHEAFFAQHGRRQRVFCASLADVFDNVVPGEWLSDLFDLIRVTPHLDWLLLTKRIGNWKARLLAVQDAWSAKMAGGPKPRSVTDDESDAMNWVGAWLRNDGIDPIPENIWLGATICNQAEADRDIPKLLAVPVAKRFLSMEPLLGPVDLNGHTRSVAPGLSEGKDWLTGMVSQHSSIFGGSDSPWDNRDDYDFPEDHQSPHINWVIVGGESGPGARPMHPAWVRSLRDQCQAAGVPFLFKQWGEWAPREEWSFHARMSKQCAIKLDGSAVSHDDAPQDVGGHRFELVGKKAAGRLLDGRTWDQFPGVEGGAA